MSGLEDISTSLKKGRNEIQVAIDRDKAAKHGLTAQDVSQIFQFTLGGMRLRRFNAGPREVETWLALRMEDRQNLDDLKALQIGSPAQGQILLGDIADFRIVRRAQARTVPQVPGPAVCADGLGGHILRERLETGPASTDVPDHSPGWSPRWCWRSCCSPR